MIYGVTREFRESLAWADTAIKVAPDGSLGYVNKGYLLLALTGDADSARAVWENGKRLFDPGDTLTHDESIVFELWARDTAAIFDRLERMATGTGVETPVETGERLWLQGHMHHFFGHPEEAREPFDSARLAFEGAGEVVAADPEWMFILAQTYAGLDRGDEARVTISRAMDLVPEDLRGSRRWADALHHRAIAEVMLGDHEAAIETLEAIHATGAGYHSSGRLRAEIYWDALRDDPRFQALLAAYDADLEGGG